jgi:hypothetical protein
MSETKTESMTITREWYDAFQRGEFDRWTRSWPRMS